MSRTKLATMAALASLAAVAAVPTAAQAQRGGGNGGGRIGDTYIDDAQKNPRFIEPGAQNDPARYRIGAPYEGYVDRKAAAEGYYHPGSGYYPVAPRRGRVVVEPYNGR